MKPRKVSTRTRVPRKPKQVRRTAAGTAASASAPSPPPSPPPFRTDALRGHSRLAFDAVQHIADIVEAMHLNIAHAPGILDRPLEGRTTGITGVVYSSIRTINGGVRDIVDMAIARLRPASANAPLSPGQEAWLAVLNGVLGDQLEASGNPLALPMRFRRDGRALELQPDALASALPQATGKLLVVVHGLCMNDLQWTRQGHNHAEAVADEFGYTPVYLHYNSGRHISTNGREFALMLETLVANWPVPVSELSILMHSMGGLVTRSAHFYGCEAGHAWPRQLRKLIFLGTPHHGAPLERRGHALQTAVGITPYSAPLARLGMLRSAGVTDLRHGNLLDADWEGHDRFERSDDTRQIVPLPEDVVCYAAAATTGARKHDLKDRLLADGLVPVSSALGQHRQADRCLNFPKSQTWVGYGMNHWDLLDSASVHQQIRNWVA